MGNEIKTAAASETQARTTVVWRELGERELVDRLVANEPAAWREFRRRYERAIRGGIFGVLRRYGAVLDGDAQKDLIQEFYLGLLENDRRRLRVFDPTRSQLKTWLHLLAYNAAADYARKLANRPRTVDLDELLAEEDYAVEEDALVDAPVAAPRERYDVLDAHIWWLAARAAKKEGR